ncbi:MAG TPA: TonB-dependent receptor [Steroidobacteraceae bacterium]|nr:TonB-dependent receptor [Steroidobacteraceae bacterium]
MRRGILSDLAIVSCFGAASLAAPGVMAQNAAAAEAPSEEVDTVVVTGFRASLKSAADAKRDSITITDSVFAEDIGKFPDLNIAEALNRVPGVIMTREVNGEGLNISIRGLGTSFTKTVINGAQISVASSGRADSQNTNREVDLDLFPTELFARLDVNKSPTAGMLEGGLSGVVNMRTQRPFDNPGSHVTYQAQADYGEISGDFSPRGALTASWTNDTFGVLFGISAVDNKYRTTGLETIGWTNATLSDVQCGNVAPPMGQNTCNDAPIVGNGYNIPATVPATGAGPLVPGTTIDQAYLLSLNPGVTIEELGDAIIPRLARPADFDGSRARAASLLSLEYRPTDTMRFYLDTMYSKAKREFERLDMNWVVRNSNSMIPVGLEIENNVVMSGTFHNSSFFLEARDYQEDVDFWNFNPGATFEFSDNLALDLQLNKSRSWFFREAPTVLVSSPLGITVEYDNTGDYPVATPTNFNLNDPAAGWTWVGGRLNIQNEKRLTHTEGAHADLRWGDDRTNLKFGLAYDQISRGISGRDNSGAWEDVACRGLNADGTVPNPRPACDGNPANAAQAPLITQSELAGYLAAGPGFISVDFDRFFADSRYYDLNNPPAGFSAATGAGNQNVEEETLGTYLEGNWATEVFGRVLRLNGGVRYIETDQFISAPNNINGVRVVTEFDSTYEEFLPSLNVAFNITENIVTRLSASRTLTRANPNAMRPATTFNDPAAQNATQGNPFLEPFLGDNIDIGGEWYTGEEGYVSVTLFQKELNAFTVNELVTVPFADLGIPFASLSATQQQAINNGGGPDNWFVNITRQTNLDEKLKLQGYELIWAQPLTFLLDGLGFTANYTHIKFDADEGVSETAFYNAKTGVSPNTYNGTVYYEQGPVMMRVSYTWNEQQITGGLNQNNLAVAGLFADDRGQLDFSASYRLENVGSKPTVTLNVSNLLSEHQRSTFWQDTAAFTFYEPGYSVLLGIRGTF